MAMATISTADPHRFMRKHAAWFVWVRRPGFVATGIAALAVYAAFLLPDPTAASMSGGVFVTVRVQDERIRADLQYLKVGQGKYFTFFRPYHLWFLEAPISIARAHLYRQVTLAPLDRPVAEPMTRAKRDLKPGERLDDFGGYTFHGIIDRAEVARELNALPVGLARRAELARPVSSGQILTWDDVRLDEKSIVAQLRRQQDQHTIPSTQ